MGNMLNSKKSILDCLLIIGGVGLNFFGASTDDNSSTPLSNLVFLLLVVVITGIASFALARWMALPRFGGQWMCEPVS
jgi:hypothetical protein